MADGKKTIETLQATKNQTKTARLLKLSWSEVHGVMERAVARGLARRDPNKIYEHVCMDEKSIRRGHEYVTILYDGTDGTVIEVEEGRTKKSTKSLCTKALSKEQRAAVKTVCTDMWDAFIWGANTFFPNAKHCHDPYHCVTYLNAAVDKVRKREVKTNELLKRTKYIWLKDQQKYSTYDTSRFEQLRSMNLEVMKAWEVKEIFRGLIPCHYDGDLDFYREWSEWFDYAAGLNIDEISTVAYMFKRHLQGIRNSFVTKTNNGKAERMNGSIQELKTIGRGFRNAERFRITILFFHGKLNMDRS